MKAYRFSKIDKLKFNDELFNLIFFTLKQQIFENIYF